MFGADSFYHRRVLVGSVRLKVIHVRLPRMGGESEVLAG